MQDKILELKNDILKKLAEAKDLKMLEEIEIKYLGRKGEFTQILRNLVNLSDEEKRQIGTLANEIKQELQEKFNQVKEIVAGKNKDKFFIDATLPGKKVKQGNMHPISLVQAELEELFSSMGFMVLDGPELESDYYCFESLNIPRHHPARDMQDTFYIDKKNKEGEYDMVMRTHTSPVQVRAMQKYGAPLRMIVPGRCFRCEATDVRHEHTFYQFEGLMIDKNVSIGNMLAVLGEVAKKLYGPDTKIRLRPKFYPFVEPGFNGEVSCFLCHGEGCKLCKHSGWLEIFGAGMVHPNVLKAGGIEADTYTGFAFGFGLSRVVQLKYGIEDVRLYNSGDLRFLKQF